MSDIKVWACLSTWERRIATDGRLSRAVILSWFPPDDAVINRGGASKDPFSRAMRILYGRFASSLIPELYLQPVPSYRLADRCIASMEEALSYEKRALCRYGRSR